MARPTKKTVRTFCTSGNANDDILSRSAKTLSVNVDIISHPMADLETAETNMTSMGRVVIAGGTGFLGQNLASHLTRLGWDVVVIARHPPNDPACWRHAVWDARTVGEWIQHLDGADALVNLAGRTVDCIKTPEHCDEILRSRVESTAVLGRALQSVTTLPRVWVQMSTAHIYGDPPEVVCDENSAFAVSRAG